jgi:WD40 repeat protein
MARLSTPTPWGIITLEGHAGAVNCSAFSPDGKRLASGSREMVLVWEAGDVLPSEQRQR